VSFTQLPVAVHPAQAIALVAQPGTPPPVPKPADPGGQGEDFGKSSPLGFLVLIVLLVAVVFLARSMTKHLKRVPASFDESEMPEEKGAEDTTKKAE
jgi:hypothetical protein